MIPSAYGALLDTGSPCTPLRGTAEVLHACRFGARGDTPQALLVGDSHARHWRAAVDVAADIRGWTAVSMTGPGCAFSTDVYPTGAARCRQRNRAALRWLRAHPGVHTLFTAASAGRGLSAGGFAAMLRQVPGTVRRIYVIRDVPRGSLGTFACVHRLRLSRERSAGRCAIPRSRAVFADPAFSAALGMGGRVRGIDLTRHFCSARWCFPVVGGSYVFYDDNHMNSVFAATLGPYLLRRLRD